MSTDTHARQPAGTPAGGQFAATARAETGPTLTCGEPALLTPGLEELVRDELANHEAMVREASRKGDDLPPDPTLGSLADSLSQMPDDILESITSLDADEVRAQFQTMLTRLGPDTPLDLDDLDVPAGPVDLDQWAPGQHSGVDAAVRAELTALRERVAELEKDANPFDDVDAHIRAIAAPAGYHPTKGVMPAVLMAISERGEGDDWVIKHLDSADLGDMYDEHVGPVLDQLQDEWRDLVEDRTGVATMIDKLETITRLSPGDFDHRSAARELYDTWGENDIDAIDYQDVWVALRNHSED